VRATRPEDRIALGELGNEAAATDDGVVFVAGKDFADWQAVEDELSEAFVLAQEASAVGAPVVFVVDSDTMLGRGAPLDSMVATGLVSGARSLAFEGLRKERYVGILATDRSDSAGNLAAAVHFAIASRAGHGQVITLGTGHAGSGARSPPRWPPPGICPCSSTSASRSS
jgi:hypothetical protein